MSGPPEQGPRFYVTGGTIKPGADSYIVRKADRDLLNAVLAGEFCYILTTRQMGKSSLMANIAARLVQEGVRTAQVDLNLIGADRQSVTADEWYYGVAYRILRDLTADTKLDVWWMERRLMPAIQRFTEFLSDVVLDVCSGKVVVFIDEIDSTIGLQFCDDFFAALRACHNRRAKDERFQRLAFVLLGVATPAQLIRDPARTPFNIGKEIGLTDFTSEEADFLTEGLHATNIHKRELLNRILYWTDGHPYLTQALSCAVAEELAIHALAEHPSATELVDREVERLFLGVRAVREEKNLKFVDRRLRQGGADVTEAMNVYRRVLRGVRVQDRPAYSVHAALKLAGVVKPDSAGLLRVRNRIYERVFNADWVASVGGRGRRARLVFICFASLALSYMIYSITSELVLWRRGQNLERDIRAHVITGPNAIWRRWAEISKGSPQSLALFGPRHIVKDALASEANQIILRFRQRDSELTFESDWQQARTYLARALELDPGDSVVRGKLLLCEGQIDRIDARSIPYDVQGKYSPDVEKHSIALLSEALEKLESAQRLLPESPDPQIALAWLYVYGWKNVDAGNHSMKEAEHRGYKLGRSDVTMLADGYRERADRLWDSRNAGTLQEKDQLPKAAEDYRRALDLYQSTFPYGDSSKEIVYILDRLQHLQVRINELERGELREHGHKTTPSPR